MIVDVMPPRPVKVPPGAVWVPPGDDFGPVEAKRLEIKGRGNVRCSVQFVIWTLHGWMLYNATARCLHVRKPTHSEGKALLWSDWDGPVPGVWLWTLADERAEAAS